MKMSLSTCSFPFDLLFEVMNCDRVIHENGKTDENQTFNATDIEALKEYVPMKIEFYSIIFFARSI